jgi:hypothetical protein
MPEPRQPLPATVKPRRLGTLSPAYGEATKTQAAGGEQRSDRHVGDRDAGNDR